MLLLSNNYAFTEALTSHSLEVLSFGYGLTLEVNWTVIGEYLTYLHNFSAIIRRIFFYEIEVPPFHLGHIICFIISMLDRVELWVELRWNYMKFHPNSTHNSTMHKPLIIRAVAPPRWKGGITNDKKYFSENMAEKVLTTVKNCTK